MRIDVPQNIDDVRLLPPDAALGDGQSSASVVDLKFLSFLPQAPCRNFKSKTTLQL